MEDEQNIAKKSKKLRKGSGTTESPPTTTTRTEENSLRMQNMDLDNAVRYAISIMQQFYRFGYSRRPNFITTDWCDKLLQELAEATEQDPTAATRADALMQTMQLMMQLDSRSAPFPLPRPRGETYRVVLEIYRRTPTDSLYWARRARALVHRMETDYRQAVDLYLKPTVVEWNLVLMTCAKSQHPGRAELAVDILLEDMLLFYANNPDPEEPSSPDGTILIDASSLVQVLRACAYGIPSERAGVLGATQAARVWHAIIRDGGLKQRLFPTLPSLVYATFLQSLRHLPPSYRREYTFQLVWNVCCQLGKVNMYVIQEMILHCKPQALLIRCLGGDRFNPLDSVKGLSARDAAIKLERLLPKKWTEKAD